MIRWKRNLAKFENEQYKTGLASGEFQIVHGYSGDILQVMPWPIYMNMTDHDLRAVYEYLRAIPTATPGTCGGPGEAAP